MPHPIGTQISEFYFSQKTQLFFNSNEAEIMCLHCTTLIHKLLLLLSENKREEK